MKVTISEQLYRLVAYSPRPMQPKLMRMNPFDVTELSREQCKGKRFVTDKEMNPVPMNEESPGHVFAGVSLTSDPSVKQGTIEIDSDTYQFMT